MIQREVSVLVPFLSTEEVVCNIFLGGQMNGLVWLREIKILVYICFLLICFRVRALTLTSF